MRPLPLLALLLCLPAGPAAADLAVRDAWVRAVPPVSPMTAGYLELANDGDRPRSLVAVRSPQFGRVELHRTVTREGVARMVPQERIQVPPGGGVALEPGSYHLMLMEPVAPLAPGDPVVLELRMADGEVLRTTARVRADGGMADDHHHHHHHH
jgi:hypothetical protein